METITVITTMVESNGNGNGNGNRGGFGRKYKYSTLPPMGLRDQKIM